VPLPDGGELRTLHDARAFLLRVPHPECNAEKWQTAIAAVLLVGDTGGPTDFARIGMMQALYPSGALLYNASRKVSRWGRRRLSRD
jgi:hypothetical protein